MSTATCLPVTTPTCLSPAYLWSHPQMSTVTCLPVTMSVSVICQSVITPTLLPTLQTLYPPRHVPTYLPTTNNTNIVPTSTCHPYLPGPRICWSVPPGTSRCQSWWCGSEWSCQSISDKKGHCISDDKVTVNLTQSQQQHYNNLRHSVSDNDTANISLRVNDRIT